MSDPKVIFVVVMLPLYGLASLVAGILIGKLL